MWDLCHESLNIEEIRCFFCPEISLLSIVSIRQHWSQLHRWMTFPAAHTGKRKRSVDASRASSFKFSFLKDADRVHAPSKKKNPSLWGVKVCGSGSTVVVCVRSLCSTNLELSFLLIWHILTSMSGDKTPVIFCVPAVSEDANNTTNLSWHANYALTCKDVWRQH